MLSDNERQSALQEAEEHLENVKQLRAMYGSILSVVEAVARHRLQELRNIKKVIPVDFRIKRRQQENG
jgi:hypothetical protein